MTTSESTDSHASGGSGWHPLSAQAEATLRRLLDAGRTVIQRCGYHDISIDDIVKEAGVSRSTFYLYFKDKADLLRAVVVEAGDGTSDTMVAPPTYAPGAAGLAEVRRWVEQAAAVSDRYGAVWQAWRAEAPNDPTLLILGRARLHATHRDWANSIAESPASTRTTPSAGAIIANAFAQSVFAFLPSADRYARNGSDGSQADRGHDAQREAELETVARFTFAGLLGGIPPKP